MKTELISPAKRPSVFNNIGKSLLSGLGGYFLFLIILLATKTISIFIQTEESLKFETTDFILPIIGFFLLFLIKLLENLRED